MQLPVLASSPSVSIHENSPAQDLILWSLERFANQRMVITTGFGMEGCALIDLYAAHGIPLEVIYLDTGFFFSETHRLIERLKLRYPHLTFVDRGTRLKPEQQARIYGSELWRKDPDQCCHLRKVAPMVGALKDVDVWITALRRGQSASRRNLKTVEWSWKYQLLKISPVATWTRAQIREYVDSRSVPYNDLHDRGYPSIGCTHCTQPVEGMDRAGYSREGRWAGRDKTECGLHS